MSRALNAMARALNEFKKLSPVRQSVIMAITVWNLWLSVSAERDIQRRPAGKVHGSKAFWRLVCLTNTVGPLSYFRWGRK